MKKYLPWFHQSKTKTVTLEFPNILRFITEPDFATAFLTYMKIFFVSFVSGFIVIVILFQLSLLAHNVALAQTLQADRQSIVKEIAYWQQVGDQYKNYRDIYFRIATLEYRLGNLTAAQQYVDKALQLDPNFEQGKVLGAQIKAK
jgi:tetratricopeptide (TPR) repeat protein